MVVKKSQVCIGYTFFKNTCTDSYKILLKSDHKKKFTLMPYTVPVYKTFKEGFSILFFVLRQRPRTSLQHFALEHRLYKAKHCRDVLGRCLRTKNKIQNQSFSPNTNSSSNGELSLNCSMKPF